MNFIYILYPNICSAKSNRYVQSYALLQAGTLAISPTQAEPTPSGGQSQFLRCLSRIILPEFSRIR
jgi:hypothetical protein